MIFLIFDILLVFLVLGIIKGDGSKFPIVLFMLCSFFSFFLLYGGYLELKKQ
jgi:hypothetical protein